MTCGHLVMPNFTTMHLEGTLQLHSKLVFHSELVFLSLADGEGRTTALHQDIRTRLKKSTCPCLGKGSCLFSQLMKQKAKPKEKRHITYRLYCWTAQRTVFLNAVRSSAMGASYHRCLQDKIYTSPEDTMLLTSPSFWVQYCSNWLKFCNLGSERSRLSPWKRSCGPCGRRTLQVVTKAL